MDIPMNTSGVPHGHASNVYEQLWTAIKNGDNDELCSVFAFASEKLNLELRNKTYRTPLLAVFREPELIRNQRSMLLLVFSLVGNRANIQATDPHGRSSLHYAALLGNLEITEFLLERGAEDILPDKAGRLAIHDALY